jgi:hypothetical protein
LILITLTATCHHDKISNGWLALWWVLTVIWPNPKRGMEPHKHLPNFPLRLLYFLMNKWTQPNLVGQKMFQTSSTQEQGKGGNCFQPHCFQDRVCTVSCKWPTEPDSWDRALCIWLRLYMNKYNGEAEKAKWKWLTYKEA